MTRLTLLLGLVRRTCGRCGTPIRCYSCATHGGCWHRLCAKCGAA
ncbi:hypothetical protein [Frankia sp. ACN1ag]|nr:hypothetical protein [Frankia sp. ACN1ag]